MAESAVPLKAIDGRLALIEQAMKDLQLERTLLLRLRQQAIAVKPTGKRAPPGAENSEGDGRMGASEAVMALVSEHPGLKTEEIADRLADRIATRSSNPRRIVVNTVTNLVNRKKLKSDSTGGWVVVD